MALSAFTPVLQSASVARRVVITMQSIQESKTWHFHILERLIYFLQQLAQAFVNPIEHSGMPKDQLAELTQPQRDRLAFIELRVRFIGEIRRQDLVARFGIQSAAATRDLALYKELSPGNIDYDPKGKSYVLGPDFRPIFDYPPERVMSWLTQGFGGSDQDIQWTRIIELELVPHPDQPRPEITQMDYAMTGGSIRMRVRAAVAGYMLLRWSVDCSSDHSLREEQYRLWLSDPLALYGVENAKLAPGYQAPTSSKNR